MDTYYLRSFGCQMNEHDAERIRAVLESQGLAPVEAPDEARVIVYNTCTVRRSADERFAGHISAAARIKRQDPSRTIIVTGCLPQAEREAFFLRYPFVDAAIGPQNLDRLAEVVARPAPEPQGFFEDRPLFSGDMEGRRSRPFQAWVQIMTGCTNYCSYCIVPIVRGPERSRSAHGILAEAQALVSEGVREITLLGQNVNAYGHDHPDTDSRTTFPDLLRALDAIDGLERIRFMTSHPRDLSDDLIAAMATLPSVCEHVHLPAQSGSAPILAAMRRVYTPEIYLERVAALRNGVPGVAVTTDLIVGFPGETEADFAATLDLVRAARFDGTFTFVYSPRAGTAAAEMPDQIAEEAKRERIQRLIALTQVEARRRLEILVGKRCEVLVEGLSRHAGTLRGRTRQNVTLNFSGPSAAGAIVSVLVTDATSTTLRGHV
jgi:tRNA-2-methylthio-N6-dimethylallyladenosine synthase